MDSTESPKPLYSSDRSLPQGVTPIPADTRCKLCGCHTNAHNIYFKCPLLKDFICISCCQDEVPKPENLVEIQKHIECPTFDVVKQVCGACKRNCLQS